MSQYQFIKFSRKGGRADLILDRPPSNMLSSGMLEEILSALDLVRDDETLKVLLIRGANGTFCGGAELEDLTADTVGLFMPNYTRMFDYLNSVRGLTVAAVEGNALAQGCEIASFCDVTIATEKAFFGFPEINIGLFPPIGAAILPRLVGRNRALYWMISGDQFSAQDAVDAHLAAKIVPSSDIDGFIKEYISKIASLSAPAIVHAKRAVDGALYTPVMDALRTTESAYMLDLMNSLDPHEGIKAKMEGRPPVWKNK